MPKMRNQQVSRTLIFLVILGGRDQISGFVKAVRIKIDAHDKIS